jgi:hypothetical protein
VCVCVCVRVCVRACTYFLDIVVVVVCSLFFFVIFVFVVDVTVIKPSFAELKSDIATERVCPGSHVVDLLQNRRFNRTGISDLLI